MQDLTMMKKAFNVLKSNQNRCIEKLFKYDITLLHNRSLIYMVICYLIVYSINIIQ